MKLFRHSLLVVILLTSVTSARAALTVAFDNGTLQDTAALTGFGTTGDLMAGMDVTAFFDDNSVEAVTWASLGFPAGQAVGTGWSLTESGDTFSSSWFLTNNRGVRMNRLLIDAGPGNTVFDTFFGNAFGSPGSARGTDFTQTSGPFISGTATYRDAVGIAGNAPVGDLFRFLDLQFTGTSMATGTVISYRTDTDNLLFAGDIQPVIPEPTTFLVWSLLGLGAVGVKYRRNRKA